MYLQAKKTNSDIVICDWNEIYTNHTECMHINPPINNIDCVIAILSGQMHGYVWNKLIKDHYIKSTV